MAINSIMVKPFENLFIKKTPNNFGVLNEYYTIELIVYDGLRINVKSSKH